MTERRYELVLIFTGHMVDLPGRPVPRFPPAMEWAAAGAISEAAERLRRPRPGATLGISSGARGGDILFQEACRLHGIETRIVLPFRPDAFIETSVAGVPTGNWVNRFRLAWEAVGESGRTVLAERQDSDGFAACNVRMLELAAEAGASVVLVALLNDEPAGAGRGGSGDFAALVRAKGGNVHRLDAAGLLRTLAERGGVTAGA